jgi:ABC-type transporter Mla subunit MlaD
MALGSLNLRVSKGDFEQRISTIENKMAALQDVIERYGRAKDNLDQFMESDDSNYSKMIERIDLNIKAARKSYAALQETKTSLQETVSQMDNMTNEVGETLESAIGAVGSTINAALKIEEVL